MGGGGGRLSLRGGGGGVGMTYNVFVFFQIFFSFSHRPSSALISWSSTQVLVDHWGTFCAGGYPNVHFSFFHLHGCSGV